MSNVHKNKSRTRLYNAISGVNELTGAAGKSSRWTILFPNLAAVGDTVTVGGYVFEYVADGSEDTAGESAGTAADPHLISIGGTPTATTAAANLVAACLAETETTGAWGFLYPDDSVGCSNTTGTVTFNFFPGTAQNATDYITVTATGTDPTVTKTVTGVAARYLSSDYSLNVIDTTGSSVTKEYYVLDDGKEIGDTVDIFIKTTEGSDTPTVVGKLQDGATAEVEALFPTGAGKSATFVWLGTAWVLANEGNGTTLTFTPAA